MKQILRYGIKYNMVTYFYQLTLSCGKKAGQNTWFSFPFFMVARQGLKSPLAVVPLRYLPIRGYS